jgi:hypothetical protein
VNLRHLAVAALLGAALAACTTPAPPAIEPEVGDPAFDTSYDVTTPETPVIEQSGTHTFSSGSTLRVTSRPYEWPARISGYPSDPEQRAKRYVMVTIEFTNANPEPRATAAMLMGGFTETGAAWEWTLGADDVRYAGGPVRPGATGVSDWVLAAPETEPNATQLYATLYEPWPDGTAMFDNTPETVELHIDTTRF